MLLDTFTNKLIDNGYTPEKAKELVTDILNFTEKHSLSCLEDAFHYFQETITFKDANKV